MRNPKRIPQICKRIEKLWTKYPDQRLGQLLANYVFGHHVDIYFQEDDETLERLGGEKSGKKKRLKEQKRTKST